MTREIPCDLVRILILEAQDAAQVIVLREHGAARELPIYIGLPEALAIHRVIRGEESIRPFTHDLFARVIGELGAQVERVVVDKFVSEKQAGTFHAKMHIAQAGKRMVVDARPSDAIALAVRLGTPLFVLEDVLVAASRDAQAAESPQEAAGPGDDEDADTDDGEDTDA
ncbi:MAG: bifunctional nuclease family protein [Planctomycetes bacterium]|nr:bifunctional nuclease family protein [Planctomycetota bacterium]